jgi:hypothetical protein
MKVAAPLLQGERQATDGYNLGNWLILQLAADFTFFERIAAYPGNQLKGTIISFQPCKTTKDYTSSS